MSYTLTIPPTTLFVEDLPSVSSSMMIYDVDQNPNPYFLKVIRDKVAQDEVYFKGLEPIDNTSIFYDTKPIEVTNKSIDIVSSVPKERGIYDIVYSSALSAVVSSTSTSSVTLTITGDFSDWIVGDRVLVELVTGIVDGYYRILSLDSSTITINCTYKSTINVDSTGTVKRVQYYWNEIYTTPLGVYSSGEFSFTNSGSSLVQTYNLSINISDPGILPKQGDIIIMQILKTSVTEDTTSLTDDLDSQLNNIECEQFQFTITSVGTVPTDTPWTWTLTLDKPFPYLVNKPNLLTCFFSLLNRRNELTIDTDLFKNTWEFREIYGTQMVGDGTPLVTSVTKVTGQKNHLNYTNAGWTGLYPQLRGIIKSSESPIALFHFNDNVKDRIDYTKDTGSIELHLPNIMIQGEQSPVVFTNGKAIYRPEGVGFVSPLILKYPQTSEVVTYGWVCHDLRFVVIDDEEVVTALGYNSNRNYTLPNKYEQLLTPGNRKATNNINSPLNIVNITTDSSDNNVLVITTNTTHGFSDGDEVVIQEVEGTFNANTLAGHTYFIKRVDKTKFKIYFTSDYSLPVIDSRAYILGTGYCYVNSPNYKYFLTYRVRGKYSNSAPMAKLMPFNFTSDDVSVDNKTGHITVYLPKLTHLDLGNGNGFSITDEKYADGITDKPQWDLIVGTYLLDSDGVTVTGFDVNSVLTIPGGALDKPITFNVESYKQTYTSFPLNYLFNLGTTPPDLVLVDNGNETIFYKYYQKLPDDSIVVDGIEWILVSNGVYYHKTDCGLYLNNNLSDILYSSNTSGASIINNFNTNLVAKNPWTLGNVIWYEHQQQYRLSFEAKLLAQNWNGTTNPTFKPGTVMKDKLISEIAFLISELDSKGNVVINDSPYIYAKINPPIKKSNATDMSIALNLDF